ncbi:MAG: glucosamine inositolphosphorylceramide transferase family protein [Alphaproteobacteria bacterium]
MTFKELKRAILPALQIRKTTWDIEIYRGSSPFALRNTDDVTNPVLTAESVTDVSAEFIADPFLFRVDDGWVMFFETLVRYSNKGVICLATSNDGLSWSYRQVVLEEPFHLSYPYVFAWEGVHYMIPESAEVSSVRLYKATEFPTKWAFVGELLHGTHRDSSIFRHEGMWWMFSETGRNRRGTLSLHFAKDLTGPWQEHPASPVVDDNPHITRPGGRMLQFDGRTYRITQDVYPDYGMRLFAFEITSLTTTAYSEKQVGDGPILAGQKTGLLADRIHHMDAYELDDGTWIAAIDHARRTWQIKMKR